MHPLPYHYGLSYKRPYLVGVLQDLVKSLPSLQGEDNRVAEIAYETGEMETYECDNKRSWFRWGLTNGYTNLLLLKTTCKTRWECVTNS